MSLTTHSRFYFGYEVDAANNAIDFGEGGPELQGTVATGSYSLTGFVTALQNALNAAGALTYTVSVARATRLITIAATGNFELLTTSGTRSSSTVYTLAGYSGADKTGAATYEAGAATGSEYTTQFILQSHVPSTNWQQSALATVNKAASGQVEVVRYGTENFLEFAFKFITDTTMVANAHIRNRATGVADFRTFLQFLITKAPFEYMADEDTESTFEKMILESTPSNRDGTGYKMKELTGRGLPGYYDSGTFKFRIVT